MIPEDVVGNACDPRLVRETRLPLWAEHLPRTVERVSGDPAHVVGSLCARSPASSSSADAARDR